MRIQLTLAVLISGALYRLPILTSLRGRLWVMGCSQDICTVLIKKRATSGLEWAPTLTHTGALVVIELTPYAPHGGFEVNEETHSTNNATFTLLFS
ncbi:hypothetical protein BaRGS_00001520 [Batillaria attramentaria]|uniref:Secreted protein n=1 Tax=Batillaria attramentaria TaxID=370345 RepID=A0ABD0M7U8_9CAEN